MNVAMMSLFRTNNAIFVTFIMKGSGMSEFAMCRHNQSATILLAARFLLAH